MGKNHGIVLPGTPIAIDFWHIRKAPQAKVFLLTHCHSDHIQGLSSTWRYPIYTSHINVQWLHLKRNIPLNVFRIINAGETIEVAVGSDSVVKIVAIEANHVPGALMFLLQGYFGIFLYCGDCRYYKELDLQPGLSSLCPGDIDVLYLDNTYCQPCHEFPSRRTVAADVIRLILQHPEHVIKIGSNAIGREELLVLVGLALKEKLLVSQDQMQTLEMLGAGGVFTTDATKSRIHVLPRYIVNERNHHKWNLEKPTISIVPSALQPPCAVHGFYRLPYSDHSSFSELQEMVTVLQPRCIVPVVQSSPCDLQHFTSALPPSRPHICITFSKGKICLADKFCDPLGDRVSFTIPTDVEEFMNEQLPGAHYHNKRPLSAARRRTIASASKKARRSGVMYSDYCSNTVEEDTAVSDATTTCFNIATTLNDLKVRQVMASTSDPPKLLGGASKSKPEMLPSDCTRN